MAAFLNDFGSGLLPRGADFDLCLCVGAGAGALSLGILVYQLAGNTLMGTNGFSICICTLQKLLYTFGAVHTSIPAHQL